MPNVMAKTDTAVRHIGKLRVNPKISHHKKKNNFSFILISFPFIISI